MVRQGQERRRHGPGGHLQRRRRDVLPRLLGQCGHDVSRHPPSSRRPSSSRRPPPSSGVWPIAHPVLEGTASGISPNSPAIPVSSSRRSSGRRSARAAHSASSPSSPSSRRSPVRFATRLFFGPTDLDAFLQASRARSPASGRSTQFVAPLSACVEIDGSCPCPGLARRRSPRLGALRPRQPGHQDPHLGRPRHRSDYLAVWPPLYRKLHGHQRGLLHHRGHLQIFPSAWTWTDAWRPQAVALDVSYAVSSSLHQFSSYCEGADESANRSRRPSRSTRTCVRIGA